MTSFGFYQPDASEDERSVLRGYCKSLEHPEGAWYFTEKFGCNMLDMASENGRTLFMRGSPLALTQPAKPLSAHALLQRLATDPEEGLSKLAGSFSLIFIDSIQKRLLMAVDRMGIERLVYCLHNGRLLFGSQATDIVNAPDVKAPISHQRIFDYLFFHMIPSPNCVFEGIKKIEPGTYVMVEKGQLQVKTYWHPDYTDHNHASFRQQRDILHNRLRNAVINSSPDDATGAFLSGGLDSSTVAGYLARTQDSSPKTFSIGFDVEEYNELAYARLTRDHFGCHGYEYVVEPADIVSAFPRIAAAYDEPFGNSSVIPTYFCAKLAQEHGITHLLAGDGGDEIFAGNERYVTQQIFELYHKLPGAMTRGFLDPLAKRISAESNFVPLRKMKSYIDQANIPLPQRLESWNYAHREGVSSMLTEEFAQLIDSTTPFSLMKQVYDACPSDQTNDRLLAYDWHFTLADNDIRKVSTMCNLAGIKVSYPMLDTDLVEFAISIPASKKIRRFQLRAFYKAAMKGFLPDAILRKSKHGFGLPFGIWLKTDRNLADMIFSNLSDLKKRNYFKPEFLDSLMQQHREGHAAYYGYFIWDLAILEEWFKQHGY